jgi:hypothetical protein
MAALLPVIDSICGQLIAGEGQSVKNIDSHIAAVVGQGDPQVGAALQRLAEVPLSDPKLD